MCAAINIRHANSKTDGIKMQWKVPCSTSILAPFLSFRLVLCLLQTVRTPNVLAPNVLAKSQFFSSRLLFLPICAVYEYKYIFVYVTNMMHSQYCYWF